MTRRTHHLHVRRGFTLVEVVAAVVVLAVIGSVASRSVITAINGYVTASTQAQLHSELSIAMDQIERKLRRILIKPGYGSIAPDITSVTSTSIVWGTNSLTYAGNQLLLVDDGAASAILLDDVTAFTIQTYDESNTALGASLSGAGCDTIRRISISITLQRAGITQTLRSKIFLRATMEGAATT